ncbi:MAG: SDR family NAD(P)-dependent oxidoreductase [Candidatus Heimdallarchaeaceae archaeon]
MKKESKKRSSGQVILITGASSGIGKALAFALKSVNPKLVIVARREKRLMQVAYQLKREKIQVLPIVADVRNPDGRTKIVELTMKVFGRIDVLVNNAGFGKVSLFIDQAEEEITNLIETNVLSLIQMTKKVVPIMKEQGSGHIINLSSTLAALPPYPFAVYSATKSAVKTFGDCIREEVLDYGIDVSTVLPGPYNTEFNKVAGIEKASFKGYNVEKLAKKIASLILKPKDNLISPWFFTPLIWLTNRSKNIRKKVSKSIANSLMKVKEENSNSEKLSRILTTKEEKVEVKINENKQISSI